VKYIVDASILRMVGYGDHLKIQLLGWHRKCDVAVPEPVVVHSAAEVRKIPKADAVRRWKMLLAEMPRVPWTASVTDKLLAFERPAGVTIDDVDAITAAHALAHEATVLTMSRAPYAWIGGLRVDEL
jgi:hypothetical protein